jgi:hypothetical protein
MVSVDFLDDSHEFWNIQDFEAFVQSNQFNQVKKSVSISIHWEYLKRQQGNKIPNKAIKKVVFGNNPQIDYFDVGFWILKRKHEFHDDIQCK